MTEVKVKVTGMHCNHCKIRVENSLSRISGIKSATADIVNGEVSLKGENIDLEQVKSSIENTGYSFGGKLD
jgi:hypothetical protein